MAFGLIVQNPEARDFSYRKLESGAKGGNACVIVGETDVNFKDAVRIPGFRPFDFAKPEEDMETFQAVAEYARRIKRHGAIALAELAHPGKEKVPFRPEEETIGPVETVNLAGVTARPMTKDDMDRIAKDFAVAAVYMQKAGFDGVLIHGGHGFLFTQFLSPLMNTRTDEYGGSLENRAKFPIQVIQAIRAAVGEDFLIELRIDGTDHQPGGITADETGQFIQWVEDYITSVHVTCGIYEESVKSGTESSMFHPHGLNIEPAATVKKYTRLPVGAVGGINSPEMCEEAIAAGKVDFVILGRQMLADPEFANKCIAGEEDRIRRCLRCYKCFPGSPEEGYDDLPFSSEELALYVGHCTINPLAHLPFDPDTLPDAKKSARVLVVGGGVAGLQAAITESFGMYREALMWEMEKCGVASLTKTKCLEIQPDGVVIENADGVQKLPADTVIYALGMKTVDTSQLRAAAGDAEVFVVGDAIKPAKVDQATRSAYLAGLEIAK